MYTDKELAEARQDYQRIFLIQRATINEDYVDKAGGGRTKRYRALKTNVPCRQGQRIPARAAEEPVGGQTQVKARLFIEFPVGTPVKSTYQIVIGTTAFEVVDTDEGRAEALSLFVEVKKAQV